MTASITVRLHITGHVQGAGYRAWAAGTAQKLSLTGWVRNLTDGSVEAVVQGAEIAVQDFKAACRKGPPLARVLEVHSTPAIPFTGKGFTQAPMADPA